MAEYWLITAKVARCTYSWKHPAHLSEQEARARAWNIARGFWNKSKSGKTHEFIAPHRISKVVLRKQVQHG